jgi:hypothetical protein
LPHQNANALQPIGGDSYVYCNGSFFALFSNILSITCVNTPFIKVIKYLPNVKQSLVSHSRPADT